MAKDRIHVWVETTKGGTWRCPEFNAIGSTLLTVHPGPKLKGLAYS